MPMEESSPVDIIEPTSASGDSCVIKRNSPANTLLCTLPFMPAKLVSFGDVFADAWVTELLPT